MGALQDPPDPPDHPERSDGADRDETFTLEIAALSNGREGLGRHEGKVVFVPGVAPGDRVRARITESHASYARAALVEILEGGAARRTPPCPWIDACGGCAWQQVTYAAQLEAKARNVRDALARIGGVHAERELAIIPAPNEWNYRRRIRLHIDAGRLGYRAARSRRLVEIETCGVADPVIAALVAPVRTLIPQLRTRLVSAELIANGREGAVVLLTARDALRPRDGGTLRAFVTEHAPVAGVRLRGHGWQRSFGDVHVAVRPEAAAPPIVQPAGAFSQVNESANQRLVATVLAMAAPATNAVDLFCGTGNLSLPLARAGLSVWGFDRDRTAIAAARASAKHPDLGGRAHFAAHEAIDALGRLAGSGPDLVVLDPPRGGAPDVARKLGRLHPPRVLYVSCDPATLARDAKTLAAAGYRIDRVQPIDLFPQTEHVETVLEAALTGP